MAEVWPDFSGTPATLPMYCAVYCMHGNLEEGIWVGDVSEECNGVWCVCVCVHARAWVHAWVCTCMRACMRVRARTCVCAPARVEVLECV